MNMVDVNILALLIFSTCIAQVESKRLKQVYINKWVVEINDLNRSEVDALASRCSFRNLGPMVKNYYTFVSLITPERSYNKSTLAESCLSKEKQEHLRKCLDFFKITFYQQVTLKHRTARHIPVKKSKRSTAFNASKKASVPKWVTVLNKHNITKAWCQGATGKNVSMLIVGTHEEDEITTEQHTAIAYDSNIRNINLNPISSNDSFPVDEDIPDAEEANALGAQNVDIYSNVWGPDDDGDTVESPEKLTLAAVEEKILKGRKGKGAIYTWASGNGGKYDDCAADGYVTSIYTIAIGAATYDGQVPFYSEPCSSIMASALSQSDYEIVGGDVDSVIEQRLGGTTDATGIASAIIALTLEANPELTWRDVQHIIVNTANRDGLHAPDWRQNPGGKYFSRHFGFGLFDAGLMVYNAKQWKNVPPAKVCNRKTTDGFTESNSKGGQQNSSYYLFNFCRENIYIESVVVIINLNQTEAVQNTVTERGDFSVSVEINGYSSILLSPREYDDALDGFVAWKFMTLEFWGTFIRYADAAVVISYPHRYDDITVRNPVNVEVFIHGTSAPVGMFGLKGPLVEHCTRYSDDGMCTECDGALYLHDNACVTECPNHNEICRGQWCRKISCESDRCSNLIPNCVECESLHIIHQCTKCIGDFEVVTSGKVEGLELKTCSKVETTLETTLKTSVATTTETTVATTTDTTLETTVKTTSETTLETTVETTLKTTQETTLETTSSTVAP